MSKTIVREMIIALLVCLAIVLLLSVLLYGYIPNNKVVPEAVAYTVPEEVKDVLKESNADTSQVILTYEVNSSDLSTAQRTNNYKPGKVNPFSSYQVETQDVNSGAATNPGGVNSSGTASSGDNSSTTNNSNGENSNSSNNSNSSTNGGTYFKDKGTK